MNEAEWVEANFAAREADGIPPRVFYTTNVNCGHCGFGLLAHRRQVYCPADNEEAGQNVDDNREVR